MKMKKVFCIVMVLTMAFAQITPAYAGDDVFTKSSSEFMYGQMASNRVHINAKTDLTVHTTWYAFNHWVKSQGNSTATGVAIAGCQQSLTSHKVTAKVSGFSIDFTLSTGSASVKPSSSGKTAIYESKMPSFTYSVYADCTSLKGYKEIHEAQYDYKKYNKAKRKYYDLESILVTTMLSYGI